MLQREQVYLSCRGNDGFMHTPQQRMEVASDFGINQHGHETAFNQPEAAPEEKTKPDDDDADAPLDDVAESEREYVRERLREELKREPTEQELDEWLRQHTEGY
jgi:hypothetical protein